MSTLQTFFGPPAVTLISGSTETVNVNTPTVLTTGIWRAQANLLQTLSGALTANTYKTVLSVTGAGSLSFAAVSTVNSTSRNLGLRITVDGTVVSSRIAVAVNAAGKTVFGVGSADGVTGTPAYGDVRFNKSLLIEIQSSITETDNIYLLSNYQLTS